MTNLTRTVQVNAEPIPVQYIDLQGVRQNLGTVSIDSFEGESMVKHQFIPAASSTHAQKWGGRPYSLGHGSSRLATINPADVQQHAIEGGWTPVSQYAEQGGVNITTIYRGGNDFGDFYSYDNKIWEQYRKGNDRPNSMFVGLKIETDLRVGHMAVTINQGIFRLVCTNGLIDESVFTGTIRHSHATISKGVDALRGYLASPKTEDELFNGINNSVIGGRNHFEKAVSLIRRYRTELGNGELSPQMAFLSDTLSPFTGKNNNHLMPKVIHGTEGVTGMLDMFDLMTDDLYMGDKVTSFDVLNAATNTINLMRASQNSDANLWRQMAVVPSVITAVSNLTGMVSIFSDN